MLKKEFYEIVKLEDIQVSIPKNSHFSIGTSPYYAHQHGLAIDIYQNLALENYDVLSPVSGKIREIKSLLAPKPKFFDGHNIDYLILINNPNNLKLLWKIMHVKPCVKVGENIKIGDLLGNTIRNGYFAYWASPHLHLEVRSIDDAIRARGGKDFSLVIDNNDKTQEMLVNESSSKIPIKIHSIFPEMILAILPESFYHYICPFFGFKICVNTLNCILDGGIPHYKIGTILFKKKMNFKTFPAVYFGSIKIGTLYEINQRFGFLKFNNIKFFLNNRQIRGISLYLANFLPLIKLIPFNKNEFFFKPNSIQYLSIDS
ncbi:MAG: M23 family metallopeptidase [Candidatus Odinarchaeota archaeon]